MKELTLKEKRELVLDWANNLDESSLNAIIEEYLDIEDYEEYNDNIDNTPEKYNGHEEYNDILDWDNFEGHDGFES